MNKLDGPVHESIDLINQVSERVGATFITLLGFTQELLRKTILQEREWDFFGGKRREDQIRQGIFIANAVTRGKNAQPFRVLFPIPQVKIDANPALEQNEGY